MMMQDVIYMSLKLKITQRAKEVQYEVQSKAIKKSLLQLAQWAHANPFARMPHSRNF